MGNTPNVLRGQPVPAKVAYYPSLPTVPTVMRCAVPTVPTVMHCDLPATGEIYMRLMMLTKFYKDSVCDSIF